VFRWLALILALSALGLSGCTGTETSTDPEPIEAPLSDEAAGAEADPEPEPGAEVEEDEADAEASAEDDATMGLAAKLDINVATDEELATIPGVGERMIHEFEEYRPYTSIEQFRREIGKYVDEATVAGYEDYIFVPIDPNEADQATLMQLPGVDEAVATELAAGRPYADRAAFLAALAAQVGDEDAAMGEAYVAQP